MRTVLSFDATGKFLGCTQDLVVVSPFGGIASGVFTHSRRRCRSRSAFGPGGNTLSRRTIQTTTSSSTACACSNPGSTCGGVVGRQEPRRLRSFAVYDRRRGRHRGDGRQRQHRDSSRSPASMPILVVARRQRVRLRTVTQRDCGRTLHDGCRRNRSAADHDPREPGRPFSGLGEPAAATEHRADVDRGGAGSAEPRERRPAALAGQRDLRNRPPEVALHDPSGPITGALYGTRDGVEQGPILPANPQAIAHAVRTNALVTGPGALPSPRRLDASDARARAVVNPSGPARVGGERR